MFDQVTPRSNHTSDQGGGEPPEASDAPWGIKSIATTERKAALAAAKRANKTVGEWLGEAIRAYVATEREDRSSVVMPPAAGDGLTVVAPRVDPPGSPTLDEIEQALRLAARIADLRGAPLKPNSRILVTAQRLLARKMIGEA